MEIKTLNENKTVKNIFVKDNGEWIKFETTGISSKSKLYDGVSFYKYTGATLDLSNYDTSEMTNMNYMFKECANLTSLDISSFDTSNITNMAQMFQSCGKFTSIDVSNLNTFKVTNMFGMFNNLKLTSLDVSNFNTSNVTDMGSMFNSINNLTSLDVSSFDTSNVTNMSGMFGNCNKLISLDLTNWNISNVTDMNNMFDWCGNLTLLNINNIGINKTCNKLSTDTSSKLSKESILYIFNNAFDRATAGYSTFTIKLHATTKALLSDEEIAIATNKGFTIA